MIAHKTKSPATFIYLPAIPEDMKKLVTFLLILIIMLTAVLIYAAIQEEEHLVVKVIDGDTFVVRSGETVRMIGIDAPEKGSYYYEESKAKLEALISNKTVALEKDKSEKDRYGRLLRYVYFNGTFINLVMVEEGFAKAYPYAPDTSFKNEFQTAENSAKEQQLAVWTEGLTENHACTKLGCETGAQWAGSKNSNKYHECDSMFARMISKENIICFKTEQQAEDAGYAKS